MDAAEAQLRMALDVFAKENTTDDDWSYVTDVAESQTIRALSYPAGRAISAFLGSPPHLAERIAFEGARRNLAQQNHLILRVQRRK
jgi:hypothetical protein